MTNPDPLFPPFGKNQTPNPYVQGIPENNPPVPPMPYPYGNQPVASSYGPPPPEAYQNPTGATYPVGQAPYQYPTPGGYGAPLNGYNPYAAVVPKPMNTLSLWSMISGIAGILTAGAGIGLLGLVAAIILGHLGLNKDKANPGVYNGRGFAIAGLIIGYVCVGFSLLIILLVFGSSALLGSY